MPKPQAEAPRPRWWRPLWIALLLITAASAPIAHFILRVPLERVLGGAVLTFLCISIAYYIRVRPSMKVNRAIYIGAGALWTWVVTFWGGRLHPFGYGLAPSYRLCGETSHILPLLRRAYDVGAFVGDWLGRRRNYRLPISLERS